MNNYQKQTTFNFSHKPYMEKDDFIVSDCNIQAYNIINMWPEWLHFATCIYGPKGSGKTHLAYMFAQKVMQISQPVFQVQTIQAHNINLYTPEKLFAQSPCLIIENLCEDLDNEAMFHIYNYFRDNKGYILFLANTSPSYMNFKLPDLSSRIKEIPAIEIMQPSDEMINMLLLKLFADRQLKVSAEVLKYALSYMTRSFDYAQKLVIEADRISLIKKSPISISVIKEAIEYLNDKKQADLFD